MKTYYINANKTISLCQVEIEAESKEAAVNKYLALAHAGEVDINSYKWADLSAGDLDIEAQS